MLQANVIQREKNFERNRSYDISIMHIFKNILYILKS